MGRSVLEKRRGGGRVEETCGSVGGEQKRVRV